MNDHIFTKSLKKILSQNPALCITRFMKSLQKIILTVLLTIIQIPVYSMNFYGEIQPEGLPLFWWGEDPEINFGDYLSLKIVERMVDGPVRYYRKKPKWKEQKLLAIGSVFYFANNGDVIWGSGINGKTLSRSDYQFATLDVRAVRGPRTREFLWENFRIEAPAIYGDPALLFPYLFPEFKRKAKPKYDYIVVVHYKETHLFPRGENSNIVYSTDPWEEVTEKIVDSKLVISSSLHGVIVAESYGIPARYLRLGDKNQHIFKYQDYYEGTGRPFFRYATTVEEALQMGGEPPFVCDLKALYDSFPFDFWPSAIKKPLKFTPQGIW